MAKAQPQPQPSLWPSADTSPDVPLLILGDESGDRYSLVGVHPCGPTEYGLIVPYAQRENKQAACWVIALNRLAVA